MEVVKNKESWNKILDDHFQEIRDIYFEYDYFNIYTKSYNVIPEACFWEDDNIKIFWSHFKRKINQIELFKDFDYIDLITPYGYGGPLIVEKTIDNKEIKNSLINFMEIYEKFAKEQNYICEFIRFHPIIENWKMMEDLIDITYLNNTVATDLTQSLKEIWQNMAKKTRYYTRKALNEFNNQQIILSPSDTDIDNFTNLYNKTMEKREAPQKYFFSNKFISDHYAFKNLLILCSNEAEEIGAGSIFLIGKYIVHYHLSATNYSFQYPPTRAVLWKAIEWAKVNGFKWLFFGGGNSENDNLFQFKKKFSNTCFSFYIGNIIFNKKIYSELTSLNPLSKENSSFFPQYRVSFDDTIV